MAYTIKSVKDMTYSDGRAHIVCTMEEDGKIYSWDDNVNEAAYDADPDAVVAPLIKHWRHYNIDLPLLAPTSTPILKADQVEKASDQAKIKAKLAAMEAAVEGGV